MTRTGSNNHQQTLYNTINLNLIDFYNLNNLNNLTLMNAHRGCFSFRFLTPSDLGRTTVLNVSISSI